jgi:hypothetical protein
MENENLVLFSPEAVTGSYAGAVEFISLSNALISFKIHISAVLPFTPWFFKWVLPCGFQD